jgi:hypothetical protein
MDQLTFSWGARPARTTPSDTQPAQEKPEMDSTAHDPHSPGSLLTSLTEAVRKFWSGRMSQTSFLKGTRQVSCALSISLQTAGMGMPGAYWTGDISDLPTNPDPGYSWSRIVEESEPPRKYYLSEKALAGISKRKRQPPLFLPARGVWLSMTERRAFWGSSGQDDPPR